MNIKNIIFDFGGVVMDWDPRYFSEIISMTTKKWNISWEISLPMNGMQNKTEAEA